MPCEKCGTTLLVGRKYDSSALWCPNCEGIKVVEKDELIKENGSEIKRIVDERMKIININSKRSVIGSLCATLESISISGTLFSKQTNFLTISSICYGIKKIANMKLEKFGSDRITVPETERLVYFFTEEFENMHIIQTLIHDNYLVGIRIPSHKVKEYAAITEDVSILSENEEDMIIFYKFTEDWNFNRLVASRYGIHSKVSISNDFSSSTPPIGDLENEYGELYSLSRIYYGFQFSFGSSKMLNDLKHNTDLTEIIYALHTHFFELFTPRIDMGEAGRKLVPTDKEILDSLKVTGELTPIDKKSFLDTLSSLTDSPVDIYKRLINLGIPVLNEVEEDCFILPNTLKIYHYLLYCEEYFEEINKCKSLNGAAFENLVYNCIRLYGYEMINPITKEPLLNFNIFDENDLEHGKPKSFEIDVAGTKEDVSIFIECKHWEIGSDFFRRKSIEKRKKELLDYLKKFQHKIDLIKQDNKFEFLTKDKKYICLYDNIKPRTN